MLEQADTQCTNADLSDWEFLSVFDTKFQSLGSSILQTPILASVLSRNVMGANKNETPSVPVLLYYASQDEIIPYTDVETLFTSWCIHGPNVRLTTFGAGGHVTMDVLGLGYVIQFIQDAFVGILVARCSQQIVLDNYLDPITILAELEPILNMFTIWLHEHGIDLPNATL